MGDVISVRIVSTLSMIKSIGPYNHVWQPFIEQWHKEHLMVAFSANLTGKIDEGIFYALLVLMMPFTESFIRIWFL